MLNANQKTVKWFPDMKHIFANRQHMGDIIIGKINSLPECVDEVTNDKEILNQKMIKLSEQFDLSLDEIKNFINISRWKLTNLSY